MASRSVCPELSRRAFPPSFSARLHALVGGKAPPRFRITFITFITFAAFARPLVAQAPPAASAPEQFFLGRTEGQGNVHVILSGRHGVRHRSHGRRERGGALVLDQVVEEEGKPARRRSWRLARGGGNRVTGTISDASGPVTGEIEGNVLHLRYRLAEGPSVEQWITVHPGGRSAQNRMTFRRFGLRVATAEEIIRKVD